MSKHEINEIWFEMESTKKVWKIQTPYGIDTYNRKKDAEAIRNLITLTLNLMEQSYNEKSRIN